MRFGGFFVSIVAAAMLVSCGSPGDGEASAGGQLLDAGQVAALLSPEAKAAVQSYETDVRGGIAAYKAQYGRLPESLAEIPSAAIVRETAVDLIADGLAEQVPFATRATLEKAATAFVTSAERQVLDRMKAQDAQN